MLKKTRTTKAKVAGLVLVGVVALSGAVYATSALAVGGASASTATAQVAQAATDAPLRSTILDMLEDRMGLTGPDAEEFADQMIARTQDADAGFDIQAMVDWCTQFTNDNTSGYWGMMGGTDMHDGDWGMMNSDSVDGGWGMMDGADIHDGDWGMMGGATTPDAGLSDPSSATPSGPGPQDGGSGFTPGEMMGGMMGGATTPDAGPSDPSSATPSGPGPQDSGSGFTAGGMMGGMMGTSGPR